MYAGRSLGIQILRLILGVRSRTPFTGCHVQRHTLLMETAMASINEVASQFFEACEAGKGWDACRTFCKPHATFSAQAEPLTDLRTLQEYTDWMQGLMKMMPDGRYELKS